MNCRGCVENIVQAIQAVPDVTIVATDRSTKTVIICYNRDQLATERIMATLSDARYLVVSIEEG